MKRRKNEINYFFKKKYIENSINFVFLISNTIIFVIKINPMIENFQSKQDPIINWILGELNFGL